MGRKVKATYEFWAENDAELSLQIGDIVNLLNSDDPGWWEGELNGQRGLFPSNYVEEYTEKLVPKAPSKVPSAPAKGPAKAPAKNIPIQQSAPGKKIPTAPAKTAVNFGGGAGNVSIGVSNNVASAPQGKRLERKDTGMQPGPSMLNGKYKQSRTKFGVWASNQAKIAAVVSFWMGAGAILWGGVDPGSAVIVNGTPTGQYRKDADMNFYRIICGCYAMIIGVLTFVYEKYFGGARRDWKLPVRGLVYLGLSVFFFYSDPTMYIGGFYIAVGVTNIVATILGESYEAPPKEEAKKKEEQALQSDGIFDALVQLAVMFKEQNKIGVMCFIILYAGSNIFLFVWTVIEWIDLNNALKADDQLSGWGPYAKAFGKLLDLNCSLILLPVCRTMIRSIYNISTRDQSCLALCLRNIFQFMPLDRNLAFHKLVSKVTLVSAIGHTLMHFINYGLRPTQTLTIFTVWPWISGAIICLSMLLIYSAAYDNTKRGQFEIFWYSHHFFITFFGFILFHGRKVINQGFWPFFVGPGALYLIERILRFQRARKPVIIASVTMMKPCVFSLEFIKEGSVWENNDYKEGQYLFLQAPSISAIQWHPFTISSAPQERTVTIHIRVMDECSWTYLLMKQFAQMGPGMSYFKLNRTGPQGPIPGKILGPDGNPMLHIDGPHSAPTQHIGEYSTAMIVGAGIGVTPVAATMKSVVFHRWKYFIGKTFPDNAYFLFVCGYGDIDAFRWFIKIIKDAQDEVVHMRQTNQTSMATKRFEVHIWITSVPKDVKPIDFVVDDEIGFWGVPREDDKVDKHRANFTEEDIYRAMKCPTKHTQLEDVHIYNGRPDWNPRFDDVAKKHPTGDVGVCFCGNPFIAKDLAKACHTASHGRKDGLFILHKENF